MQPTNDLDEVIVIFVLFVGMLLGHLSLAFWIGLRTRWSQSWLLLIGLSMLTSAVWLVLATPISFSIALSAEAGSKLDAYALTFGIPYKFDLPSRLLPIFNVQTTGWIHTCYATIVLPVPLFLLALFPYAFAKMLSPKDSLHDET